MMQDLSGQIINGYALHEQIGIGGFGAVYRAQDLSLGREVAIKVVLPELSREPEFIRRFESEARTIAQLDHLHIVPLIQYGRDYEGTAFLVMRYLRGGSLRTLIKAGRMSVETIVHIIDQIARALAFAHQKGVVHRDIKPDNILLDEQRNAYLSDFGIAKDIFANVNITTTSAPGTPAYAAPEQIVGDAIVPQTDLYALGIMLYECFIGEHPFPGAPLKHLYDPLPLISSQRNDIPMAVDMLVARATEKKAADRFPDAIMFAAALRSAVRPVGAMDGLTLAPPVKTTVPRPVKPNEPKDAVTTSIVTTGSVDSFSPGVPRTRTDIPAYAPMSVTPARREAPIEQTALLIRTEADIPQRPAALIGRESLLDQINALLDRGGRVVLQGLGGMGKTSLAAECAAARVSRGETPALWLHALGDDGDQLLIALARPFDAHQSVALGDASTKMQTVRGLLIEHGVKLILLDDVWDGAALKRVMDAIPNTIPVLITSRQRLPIGKILDVGELRLKEALELLNFHASESFTTADTAAVNLCERLGCHPFTVEIAGKTLQVDMVTPAELLTRIAESPHLLEMPEGFADPGRSSVKELINDSVFALDTDSRAVFLAFGALFVPKVTPDLMALLMERDLGDMEGWLTMLARRGLARREHQSNTGVTTFTVHDLAYSYARGNVVLPRSSMIKAARAYAAQFKDNLNALDAERSNILKSAEAAHVAGDTESLIAIMRALTVDGSYFNARGYDALMLRTLDQAVEAARAAGDAQAETLHFFVSRRGNARYYSNDLSGALADYQEALSIAQTRVMTAREVILRCVISKIYSDTGNFERAESELALADEIAYAANDDGLIARVLEQRGYHYAEAKKDYDAARSVFLQQVEISERANNTTQLFFALLNLGNVAFFSESFSDALLYLERALIIARNEGNQFWLTHALAPLADVYHKLGEISKAAEAFKEGILLSRQSGNIKMTNEFNRAMVEFGYAPQ